MPNPSSLLAEYPVVVELPVFWGDMDWFRHVNNIIYFRWFESARIEYLERIGFRQETEHGGVGPILHSTQARFRRPVEWPDTVLAGARTTEVGDDRFTQEYRLVSRAHGQVAAEGGCILMAYDYANARKAALPPAVRDAIHRLESSISTSPA
ncbi:thioesterase family protein [Longimicrobium sp.]|uniref:acyl-CoA thioesterase n=1 Tax=Longimicrobium sp. TaxID=2029185 RepID=UPI002C6990F4|nr:thioesterase family protein [Longimicrobium sp.]HSU12911.1 thioesterase family protein [Longimicrobium sp.]